MHQAYGSELRRSFASVLKKVCTLLLLGLFSGTGLAAIQVPVVKLSTNALVYTSPATIVFTGTVNPFNNDFSDVQLLDESGTVLATQYSTEPTFTLTGVTAGHTYHLNARGLGTDGKQYNRASNYISITVNAPVISPQSINSFPVPGGVTYGVGTITLGATASSGLAVSYTASPSSVCTIPSTGNVLSITGAGTCSVTAYQGGDATYSAAQPYSINFGVARANQAINFAPVGNVSFTRTAVQLTASVASGLPITISGSPSSVCSVSGTSLSLNSTGNCTLSASVSSNGNYNAANTSQVITISKGNQSISFGPLANKSLGSPPFGVAATSSAQLPVSFSGAGACSVSSGGTVTLTATGPCTVYADQPGDNNWFAAAQKSQVFQVIGQSQTITFSALPTKTFGDADFPLSAWSDSGLPVSFSSLSGGVCRVNNVGDSYSVTLLTGGTCNIAADQIGNSAYGPAQQKTQQFYVNKASQSISRFDALPATAPAGSSFTVNANSSSGMAVRFGSTNSAICTVAANVVTAKGAGLCTITADQDGDARYSPAPQKSLSTTVVAGPPTVSLIQPNAVATTTLGGIIPLQATASESGGTITSVEFHAISSGGDAIVATVTSAVAGVYNASWDTAGYAPGDYMVYALARDSVGLGVASSQIAQSLQLVSNVANVAMTSPANNVSLGAPATIRLAATITPKQYDTYTTTFYDANGTALGTVSDDLNPSITLTNVPVGSNYAYYATTTLSIAGNANSRTTRTSKKTNVQVVNNQLPKVSMTAPLATQPFVVLPDASVMVTVTGDAKDFDGLISSMQVLLDDVPMYSTPSSLYNQSIPVKAGLHKIQLQATDNLRGIGLSDPVQINVQTDAVPVVSFTPSLSSNYTVPAGTNATVKIVGSATSTTSTITSMAIVVDGKQITAGSGGSISGTATLTPGPHTVQLVATDSLGLAGTATANVTVTAVPVLSVSMKSPTQNQLFNAPGIIQLSADANELGGVIGSVEFHLVYPGGADNVVGTASTGSAGVYSVSAPLSAGLISGTYQAYARVVDSGSSSYSATSSWISFAIANQTPAPTVALSAAANNVRVSGAATAPVVLNGSAIAGGSAQITALAVYQDSGSGYSATPVWTGTGSATSFTLNLGAGVYRFKLKATDSLTNSSESQPAAVVNITNSTLLGQVNGVRTTQEGVPQLFGWVCASGSTQVLNYQVYLYAPPAVGGSLLTSGVANVGGQADDPSGQSACGTQGTSHGFMVDLSSYTSTYSGAPLYVLAQDSGGNKIVLPCADNSCTMPGAMRIGLTTPANGDQYAGPATVFMRALVSGADGPYDEVSFSVDGGSWTAGKPDTAAGTFYANSASLVTRAAPYSVQARVRQGNTTVYTVQNMITVGTGSSAQAQINSPMAGTNFDPGTPIVLSATANGTLVQSVQFYANGTAIGAGTSNAGTWTYSWTTSVVGSYILTAQTFDGSGHVLSTSAPVNISVGIGPAGSPSTPFPVVVTVPHMSNRDAGTLPGGFGVDNNGAATYSIPIVVPPGTAGMQPDLALSYNSSGTNGVAGLGWSLTGLSSIHRCGKTIAQDGVNRPISFGLGDRLCLDGQRLQRANAPAPADGSEVSADIAYWAANGEYRTEIESFTRVTAVSGPTIAGAGSTIAFKVQTKDGKTRFYGCDVSAKTGCGSGNSANSYVAVTEGSVYHPPAPGAPDTGNVGKAVSWALSAIVDSASNHIDFDYYSPDPNTGEYLIKQIRYGGNFDAGQSAYAAVRFVYEVRPDAWTRYIADVHNDQRSRLTFIQTYVGTAGSIGDLSGTSVRAYALTYERSQTSGRSMLGSVQMCATSSTIPATGQTAVTTCIPATTFTWGKPQSATARAFVNATPGLGYGGIGAGGCVNSGAAPCLVRHGHGTTNSPAAATTHADYFDFSDFENNGRPGILEKRVADANSGVRTVDQIIADALSNPEVPVGTLRQQYRYFHNTGSGFTQYGYTLSTGEYFVVLSVSDFNGDGYPDLLVYAASASDAGNGATGVAKVCLSPLGSPLPAAGAILVFNCNSGIAALPGNAPAGLSLPNNLVTNQPLVVDVIGDGRAAVYGPLNSSSTYLCIQRNCLLDVQNLNPSLWNIPLTYSGMLPSLKTYTNFEQMVDFSGTGKPEMVQYTAATRNRTCVGADCGSCPANSLDCYEWDNAVPKLIVSRFAPPGDTTTAGQRGITLPGWTGSGTVDYYTYSPYVFDKPMNFGTLAADLNGSGYSSLYFGYFINSKDAGGYIVAAQSKGMQCLSTGVHMDCTVRNKLSTGTIAGSNGYLKTLAVADFDGDGQPDLLMIQVDNKGNPSGDTLQLCHLMGDDTTHGVGAADDNVSCAPWATPSISPAQLRSALQVIPGSPSDQMYVMDLMGTGRPQLIYYHAGTMSCMCENFVWNEDGRWEVLSPNDLAAPAEALDRIVSVTNGLGASSTVTYMDGLANGVISYSGTASLNYPQRLTPRTGKVVAKLAVGNGGSRVRTTQYRYQDAATDLAGRGTLGFGIVQSFDPDTRLLTSTTYKQAWPYTGMVASVTVAHGGNSLTDNSGKLISSSVNVSTRLDVMQANGSKTVCAVIDSSTLDRWDLDASPSGPGSGFGRSATVNQYTDGWCNLTQQTVTLTPPGGGSVFTTQTNTTYLNDSTNWVAGLPTLVSVKKTDPVSGSLTRSIAFAYDQIPGLLHTQTIEPGDTTYQVVTTYDRSLNKYGLVSKEIESWLDPACANNKVTPPCAASKTRTVRDTTYEPLGRFPAVVKNALGHTEQYVYDGATGAQIVLTDPNNLNTKRTVDGLGRVNKELRADGNETRHFRKACAGDCPVDAVQAQISDTFHGSDRISMPQVVYSDSVGHILRSMTWVVGTSAPVGVDQRYDALGRLWESDQQRSDAEPAYLGSRYLYDDLSRVVQIDRLDADGDTVSAKSDYHGLTIIQTNARNFTLTETRNVANQLVQVQAQDAVSNITQFAYEPFGNLSKTVDPNGNVTTVEYDRLGRKIELHDPDLGFIQYSVDPLGWTWKQVSPKERAASQASYMVYDKLGRMTARYEPDLESHWVFDQATMGIGRLNEAYTQAGTLKTYDRTHSFDALGRPSQSTLTLSDGSYTDLSSYDIWGRLITQTYQRNSGPLKQFGLRYDSNGRLSYVERGSLVLMKTKSFDSALRPTALSFGASSVNQLNELRHYSPFTGQTELTRLYKGNLINTILFDAYAFDQMGNVTNRLQYWGTGVNKIGFSEDFTYDALNRLSTSQIQGQPLLTYTYDAAGNLLSKTGVGSGAYSYPAQGSNAVQPHAVQSIAGISGTFSYDANGNQTVAPGRTASWNSFDMPVQLTKGGVTSNFSYGPEHQRTRQDRNDGSVVVYAGAQEVETKGSQVTVKTYWPLGIGLEIDNPVTSTTDLRWVHRDRLGSVVAVMDQNATLVESLEYDAWGKRRMLTTNDTPDTLDGKVDNKGFTGHEMLDQLDLVHMNGRVYDPYTAKFLSADPYVTDFYNGQNYNRYSYVLNNPTNLTDPTGYEWSDYVPVYGNVLSFKSSISDGHFVAAAVFGSLAIVDGATLGVSTIVEAPLKAALKGALKQEAKEVLAKEGAQQAARATEKAATQAAHAAEQAAAKGESAAAGQETKVAVNGSEQAKNPGAKRGPKTDPDAPHNKKVRESAEKELADNPGSKIVAGGGQKPEKLIETPGGAKEGRRPDTIIEKADGSQIGINVGKTKADGTPIKREAEALKDLNENANLPTKFVPYDKPPIK